MASGCTPSTVQTSERFHPQEIGIFKNGMHGTKCRQWIPLAKKEQRRCIFRRRDHLLIGGEPSSEFLNKNKGNKGQKEGKEEEVVEVEEEEEMEEEEDENNKPFEIS